MTNMHKHPIEGGKIVDQKVSKETVLRTPYGRDSSSFTVASPEETKAKIGGGAGNLKHTLPNG